MDGAFNRTDAMDPSRPDSAATATATVSDAARVHAWLNSALGTRSRPGPTMARPRHADGPGMRLHRERLGDSLVRRGLVTPDQLERAMAVHRNGGERLGRVLLAMDLVSRQDLHRVLGELWQLPFVDLTRHAIDPALAHAFDPGQLAAGAWIPLARRGRVVVVATAEPPSAAVEQTVRGAFGEETVVTFAATTDWDVDHALRAVFRERFAEQAPARPTAVWRRGLIATAAIAAFTAGGVAAPRLMISAVIVAAIAAMGVAGVVVPALTVWGWLTGRRGRLRDGDQALTTMPHEDLPRYTVLIPVYRRPDLMAGLIQHLETMDYPADKLEVLLLLEEGDDATVDAARAARPPAYVRFVVVPAADGRSAARACNLGLLFARGDHVVTYHVDDLPEGDQLRMAAEAFARQPDVWCLQAQRTRYNAGVNALTRMAARHERAWVTGMLPALARLGVPAPLGGPSAHYRTERLREVGGWRVVDASWDADLGMRLTRAGGRVETVVSTTYEEAPSGYRLWMSSSARTVAGLVGTVVRLCTHPRRVQRDAGGRALAGLAVIGAVVAALVLAPVVWAVAAAGYGPRLWGGSGIDVAAGSLEVVGALVGVAALTMVALSVTLVGGTRRAVTDALMSPVHALMFSAAAWWGCGRALVRVVRGSR